MHLVSLHAYRYAHPEGSNNSANFRVERGVCSAGLKTIVQPAARAGAIFLRTSYQRYEIVIMCDTSPNHHQERIIPRYNLSANTNSDQLGLKLTELAEPSTYPMGSLRAKACLFLSSSSITDPCILSAAPTVIFSIKLSRVALDSPA